MGLLPDYYQAMKKLRTRHTVSLVHALDGLLYAVRTQPNFIVHLACSSIAVCAGIILNISTTEWAIIMLTICAGLAIELVNSAIEAAVDLITQEWRISAKIAKDTAAAAMLVYALGAIAIAAIIFLPKLS